MHMYPHTHTFTDTHKCHNTFKLTLLHMHAHTQPQTHTHTHTMHTHKTSKSPSFSAATVNGKQQNLNMVNENIGSCVILYCTSYKLLYQIFLLHMQFRKRNCYFSYNWKLSTR